MKIIVSVIIVIGVIILGVFLLKSSKGNTPGVNNNSSSQNSMQKINAGVTAEIIKEGTGDRAVKEGDTISVNYTGLLENGTVFDSNVDPKFNHVESFQLTVGVTRVIEGWHLGLIGMKVGEKRKLTIAAQYAYGETSPSPLIPANSTLIFEVELLEIK